MREVEGPTYSRARLRAFRILGVHLGMPLEQARPELLARGFAERPHRDVDTDRETGEFVAMFFTARFGEAAGLSYAAGPGGADAITSIVYYRPLTGEELRQIEARRHEIVAEYGAPSHWWRWDDGGRINDAMAYVTRAPLRDSGFRQHVWSCYVDWRCGAAGRVDCRGIMARAREPMLEIAFVRGGVDYRLADYAQQYALLRRRQPDFTDPRFRPETCPAFPPH